MAIPSVSTLSSLEGKRVLVRVDLNVPFHEGRVLDTTRIDRIVPTLQELIQKKARVILISHLGRPKGQRDEKLSLKPLVPWIEKALGSSVSFCSESIGREAEKAVEDLKPGAVLLLENIRFYEGEEKNDPGFAQNLASLGDVYVNEGFAVSHRAHASVEAITRFLPSYGGLLLISEVTALTQALEHPQLPLMAIVSGSKVSTKLSILNQLIFKVNFLALGGGLATTFLAAQGISVGQSLCEQEMLSEAQRILTTAERHGCQILLPQDVWVVKEIKSGAEASCVSVNQIPQDQTVVDIGPQSLEDLKEKIEKSKTLIWNGPLGVFEIPPFDAGTMAVARKVAECTGSGELYSIAGGGETVAALEKAAVTQDFSYISTAGGAFLEWVEGKSLPGVGALERP